MRTRVSKIKIVGDLQPFVVDLEESCTYIAIRDKKSSDENRGEMGRSLVTTGINRTATLQ